MEGASRAVAKSRKIEDAMARNDLNEVVDLLKDVLIRNPVEEFMERPELINALVLSAVRVRPSEVRNILEQLGPRVDPDGVVYALLSAGLTDEAELVLQRASLQGGAF